MLATSSFAAEKTSVNQPSKKRVCEALGASPLQQLKDAGFARIGRSNFFQIPHMIVEEVPAGFRFFAEYQPGFPQNVGGVQIGQNYGDAKEAVYQIADKSHNEHLVKVENGRCVGIYVPIENWRLSSLGSNYAILGWSPPDPLDEVADRPFSRVFFTDGKAILAMTTKVDSYSSVAFDRDLLPGKDTERVLAEINAQAPKLQIDFSAIKKLTQINGIPIATLEKRMRPDQYSYAGFLAPGQRLLKVLADDNRLLRELKVEPRELASLLELARRYFAQKTLGKTLFTLQDILFEVKGASYRGAQESPFDDGTSSSFDIEVTNLDNQQSIRFSGLLPELIWRYGFFEGPGTPYRLDPEKVVEVFSFLKKN